MNRSILLTMTVAAALAGCTAKTSTRTDGPDTLATTNRLTGCWHIENVVVSDSLYARPADATPGVAQTIEFNPDGFYLIATNCNSINGSYTLSGTSLRMTDGLMTEMACDNMAVEDLLRRVVPQINSVDFENDSTVRLNTDGTAYIVLRR